MPDALRSGDDETRATTSSAASDEHAGTSTPAAVAGAGVRLAVAYVALFFLAGVQLPYWPVWLASTGVSSVQVGVLLGVGTWARLVAPVLGSWADRSARARPLLLAAGAGVLACYLAFDPNLGFAALLGLSLTLGLAGAPITPLLDGIAVHAAAAGRIDYGRVRLWGSAAFIAAAVFGGRMLEGRAPSIVLTTLQLAAAVLLLALAFVRAPPPSPSPAPTPWRVVLRQPGLLRLLGAVACLHGSHAVLYGFGTAHWREVGLDDTTIGALWGVGVLAEVVLFALGGPVVRVCGAGGLLVVAGAGATVRWSATAVLEGVVPLVAISVLHAASFAAMHLGAISWIRDHVARDRVHRSVALYGAVSSGIALGVAMPLAGVLYERIGARAWFAMAGLAALGLALAWRVHARPAPPPA